MTDVLRQDATVGTPAHDASGMVKWTEDDVLRLLWRHFITQSWAPVPQVTVSASDLAPTGTPQARDDTDRRIDMLALRRPPKRTDLGPLETLAIEVKVTRADFRSDVANPAKQAAWRRAATRHAYAVPAGLVTADEVPEGSGLLAVKSLGSGGWGEVEWVRRAPYITGHAPQLPTRVLLALAFRTTNLEGQTRGWQTGPTAAGDTQALRAALQAANTAAERDRRALTRSEGQRNAWRHAYTLLSAAGHPCRWCTRPVKPLNPGADGSFRSWRHLNPADDAPCALIETDHLEREARAAYEAADDTDRAHRIRSATGRGTPAARVDAVERDPWRAYVRVLPREQHRVALRGPLPAEITPEGA